jgi:malate permease and related proteins
LTRQLAAPFVQVVLPVVLIACIGYVLGRVRRPDLGAITTLCVAVLVPAIVFDSLTRAVLPRELLARLALHVIVQLVVVGAIAWLAAAVLRWDRATRGALLLATLFSNSGNLGLPIALFAFGPGGLAIAGGWFAVQAICVHTLGVWIAAHARAGSRRALRELARQPIFFAVLLGIAVKAAGWSLPDPVTKVTQLLASGAVAVLLLLLGLHIARLELREELAGASLASAIRLLAGPPIAWVTGRMIGLEGVALAVAVVQSSTPSAVTAALWAAEFDARPGLVAASVVLSTIASVVTLTLLLGMLVP